MRIRSNLTARHLYADSRRKDASAGRRIFRLGLMLVLVLLLMQQAADPELYRRIFGALGAPLEGPAAAVPRPAAAASERAGAQGASGSMGPPLTATVAALDDDQQDQLSALLAARRRSAQAEQPTQAEQEEVSQALLQTLSDAATAGGEVEPDSLVVAVQSAEAAASQGLLRRLQAALDARYWTTVSDATVWQPGDANAFYRLLEMEPPFAEPSIRVGYSPLAAQPGVYRGRRVSLEGYAVRVEPHRAADNPFGIERYWLVWVRPIDGSERPVMLYTSQLPATLGRLSADETLVEGPRIVAEGTFLKRHLYRSQRGSELAPVIVGAIAGVEAAAGEPADGLPAGPLDAVGLGKAGPPQPPRWWLVGVIAAVAVPVAFTLWVGWQSSRAGRRQRELRARGMPAAAPFLDSLDAGSPKHDAS